MRETTYRGIRRTAWRSWIVVALVITGWPYQGPPPGASPVQSGQYRQAGLADWLTGTSTGVYVEGTTLRLQEGVASGAYESPPFQAPFGINAAQMQWHAQVDVGQSLLFDLRWSIDGQTWSEWQIARGRSDGQGGAISQLLVLPPFNSWVQYRVRFESTTGSPALTDTTVTYLNTTAGPAISDASVRVPAVGPDVLTASPPTIDLATSGLSGLGGDIVRQRPQRIVMQSIPLPADDANTAATLRALQWSAVNLEGRASLPYHFVIDGRGNVFQGPGSATALLPDVAEGTVAIALLQDVEVNGLGDVLPPALARLTGWLVDSYGLSVTAIDAAPDAPAPLRDAVGDLRARADRAVVRTRTYIAAGNTAVGAERLVLFNRGDDEARASYVVLSTLSPERREIVVPPGQRADVPLNQVVPINGPLGILLEADRPLEIERVQTFGREQGGGPTPQEPARVWYFTEGSSADGDVTTMDVLNPLDRNVEATLTFIPDGGAPITRDFTFAARAQQSVFLNDYLPDQRFAFKLVAREPVVVERTLSTATGAATISSGIATLQRRWLFAEGSTQTGYATTVTLFNPWPQQIALNLRVLSEDGTSLDRQYTVEGGARRRVALNEIAPDLPFAIDIEADRPLAVERTLTFDEGRALTIGAGAARMATLWTFAEGSTAYPAEQYLLIANPNPEPVDIEISYVLAGGRIERREHQVGAGARLTVAANADVPNEPSVSAIVLADRPIVAERTLYVDAFDGRGGETTLGFPGD